jgi:acid phosphatase family membrane protein YuiD
MDYTMITQAVISVVLSVLLGEGIKTLLQVIKKEEVHVFQLGGMPSTHSAAVSSLALATYYEEGFTILVLACVVFGWIVVRDAYGVRWEVTKHSHMLNKLAKTKEYKVAGHTLLQVIAGIILGVLVTLVVYAI